MSYKCQLCKAVSPDGQPRLMHRAVRTRTDPRTGESKTEVAAEVAVCADCQNALTSGATMRSLMRTVDESAPAYRQGPPRQTTKTQWVAVEGKPAHPMTVTEVQEGVPEIGVLYALFTRYGALSYWLPYYAEATAEDVANDLSSHWHLRKLWDRVHDLVPKQHRRRVKRPAPEKAPARARSASIDVEPLVLGDPKSSRRK